MSPPIPPAPSAVHTALSLALALLWAALAAAQDGDKVQTWTKLEDSRETREYKEELRSGGAFEDAAKSFLTQIALPQLESPANRPTIERVRRRIRELLLTDIADEKSHDAANRVVLDFMKRRARDPGVDPAVRVNAMLLVGELRSKDNKPWPAAATTLAEAADDTTLPMEVRIVALAGLGRHAEGSARKSGTAALPQTAASVVDAILTERVSDGNQTGGRWRVENDWMAARAASMLPSLTRSASKTTAAGLMTMLQDPRRSFNVRVRAAAALGATADTASGIEAAKAIDAVRALAILGIESDLATADRQRLEDGGSAGDAASATQPTDQPQNGVPNQRTQGVPEQASRQAAWRLAMLADAILAEGGDSGLALLAGDAREPAEKLAALLRESAAAIDAAPGEKSLTDALVTLGRQAAQPPKTPPPAQPKPEQPKTPEPSADPAASPFDNPFGN